ncbi:MAG: ABC transporter ATP-binding protein [Sarcina sp.]
MKKTLLSIKWLYKNCKIALPGIIGLTLVSATWSFISIYEALLAKNIIDSALSRNTLALKNNILLFILASLAVLVLVPFGQLISTYTSNKLFNSLQTKIYKNFIHSKWQEQSKFHSTEILTRLLNDIASISKLAVEHFSEIISLLCMLSLSLVILFRINNFIAIASLFIAPIFFFISKYYGRKQKELYKEMQEKEVKYNTFIQESIANLLILKTFSRENIAVKKLNTLQESRFKTALKKVKLTLITTTITSFGVTGAFLLIYTFGAFSIEKGVLTIGTFTALLQLFYKVQGPFQGLCSKYPQIIAAIAATERLVELESLDGEKFTEIKKSEFDKIIFDNVSFEYKKNQTVLDNLNLEIKKGDFIGIIGESGKGKTTILKLLLSLLDPKNGSVTIDNMPLNPSHRKLMAYVPQGDTLFSGTLKENLRYDDPNISDFDLINAINLSCCNTFVSKLPCGLDSIVGEKGIGLSGGQAQRIAIARALATNAPILILDEATAALDIHTEEALIENLNKLKKEKTIILITHRESSLKHCNKVIDLNKIESDFSIAN